MCILSTPACTCANLGLAIFCTFPMPKYVRLFRLQAHFECESELAEDRPLRVIGRHLEGHQMTRTADDVQADATCP